MPSKIENEVLLETIESINKKRPGTIGKVNFIASCFEFDNGKNGKLTKIFKNPTAMYGWVNGFREALFIK